MTNMRVKIAIMEMVMRTVPYDKSALDPSESFIKMYDRILWHIDPALAKFEKQTSKPTGQT